MAKRAEEDEEQTSTGNSSAREDEARRDADGARGPSGARRASRATATQASPSDRRIAKSRKLLPEQVSRLRQVRGLTDEAFAKIPQGKLRRAVDAPRLLRPAARP